MSERRLLFLMNAEQTDVFVRLLGAADRGDGAAACRLGDMYREGLGGLRYSPKETYRWYAKSALMGDANGQNNLGACYEHGLGCAQSYAKAVKWYRLSAAQCLGTASMNLGYCSLHGRAAPEDKAEALRLFRLAVEQGEEKARAEVERLDTPVKFGRIPKGLKDRTGDGGSVAFIGGVRPAHSGPKPDKASRIHYVDATKPGRNFGLIGVPGVRPPEPQQATLQKGDEDHD